MLHDSGPPSHAPAAQALQESHMAQMPDPHPHPHKPPPGDAHPCPRAAPPPRAEDCGDLGTYKGSWWQGGLPWSWGAVGIVIAILVGFALLRNVVGPMLSPVGP